MAKMSTVPVYACRGCGRPVYGIHVEAGTAEQLKAIMPHLAEIAICKDCKARYNWLASQNRSDEFRLNPNLIIYNVVDPSGVDWYGRKAQ